MRIQILMLFLYCFLCKHNLDFTDAKIMFGLSR